MLATHGRLAHMDGTKEAHSKSKTAEHSLLAMPYNKCIATKLVDRNICSSFKVYIINNVGILWISAGCTLAPTAAELSTPILFVHVTDANIRWYLVLSKIVCNKKYNLHLFIVLNVRWPQFSIENASDSTMEGQKRP
jgi:hypothetical protein